MFWKNLLFVKTGVTIEESVLWSNDNEHSTERWSLKYFIGNRKNIKVVH